MGKDKTRPHLRRSRPQVAVASPAPGIGRLPGRVCTPEALRNGLQARPTFQTIILVRKAGAAVASTELARKIADTDKQIAVIEARVLQLQKRVENIRVRGADATAELKEIASLKQMLKDLEASKTQLVQQMQSGAARC